MRCLFYTGAILALGLCACNKPEGEGGRSSISGKIYQIDYIDEYDNVLDTFPAVDEDVFIVYGGGDLADDDTKTNGNGDYKFEFLREGSYSIYAYNRDQEQSELYRPILIDVTLGKKTDKIIDTIYIYRSGKGHSCVTGKIFRYDYNSDGILKSQGYAGDVDVFLCRKDGQTYVDKAKTHFDGTYTFPYLRKGKYYVYAYSKEFIIEEGVLVTNTVISKKEFAIDSFAQSIALDDIEIDD